MSTTGIISEIEILAKEFSMDQVGHVRLQRPRTMDFYRQWLNQGCAGDMEYLTHHADAKENPQIFWPRAQTAIVFARNYVPHPKPASHPLKRSRLALYAQGEDYHHWFKKDLAQIAERLKTQYPEDDFLPLTDSSPVLERDLAARAGLGWVGKNTCLIQRNQGSLFFIGEIYSTLVSAPPDVSIPDFCGTCQRCIEVCPTQAIESPRFLNASKCISYLTIESRQIPPVELRSKIGDWLFGCDLCQTVCPWNQKVFGQKLDTRSRIEEIGADRTALTEELHYLLTASGKQLGRDFRGTALERAGPFGLRRNAMLVAANQHLKELCPVIENWKNDPRLGELAMWSLSILNSAPA